MTNIIDNLNSNPINTSSASASLNLSVDNSNISSGTLASTPIKHGSSSSGTGNHETCLICGDVASGKHYGLRSCEACKAFFKRTVQGKIEYSCPATRECEINKRRRKACQACRFQKCLNMGMLKEGVRLDRVRGGRQKYRRGISPTPGNFVANNVNSSAPSGINNSSGYGSVMESSATTSRANSSTSAFSRTSTANLGSTNNSTHPLSSAAVAATHSLTSAGTSETNKIMTALINCEPEELSVASTQYITNIPANVSVQVKTLNILSDLFDRELVSLIGWAKQIPGFTETITLNDQMRLLQSTWAEVIALSIGYRSHLKRIENYRQQQQLHGNGGHHNFMNTTTPSPTSSSPASTTSSSYNTNSNNNNNDSAIYNLENIEIRLVFARDLIIDFKNALTCGAEEIFYNCVQLIKRLDYLKITPKEYILLKAISLTNADVRLENPKATFRLRDLVMDALYEVTLVECLNGDLVGRNDLTSLNALDKQEAGGSSNASNYNHQIKIEAQKRPPSSMNQYASSSSSPTPPSRSSSSVPSSSSILSISPHNGSSGTDGNGGQGISGSSNLNSSNIDLGKKTLVNNRMNQVLLCLPVLRQIDTCIRKFWNDIRKGPNNVPMNKLFEEMLEPCQRTYRSSIEM